MLVKICGITSLQDAEAAVRAGAGLLGFNFYSGSPRCVTAELAASIRRSLPRSVLAVGVFVSHPQQDVLRIARAAGMDMAQLHGDESPEYCEQLAPLRVMKAFRVGPEFDPAGVSRYRADAILLDGFSQEAFGGTGTLADWQLARQASRLAARVFLSGGLRAENVAAAIAQVQPQGVDVCSGVESAPGRKDFSLMQAFVAAARAAALRLAENREEQRSR